jgi:hypothetical protein
MSRRLIARTTLAFGALCATGLLSASLAEEACDRPGVTVFAPVEEEQDACAAIEEVLRHFAAAGLAADVTLAIRFQSSVVVELAGGAAPPMSLPVIGRFHKRRNEVQILSVNAPFSAARRPFTLPWSAEIARSVLRHEIAHAVIARLLGEKYDKLPAAWHEALAYAVQIDLMSAALRQRVLDAYPDVEPFDQTTKINDFTYGFDPDAFAVRAYLTYARNGRMEFVKKALAFEHDMIDLREYFN